MLAGTSATASGASAAEPDYNCTICVANFDSKEAKRTHMRADWHVYNLKRHIALLPPISMIVFQKQVIALDTRSDESEDFHRWCETCEKQYTNRKAWLSHLKSRNHIQNSSISAANTLLSPNTPLPISDLETQAPADEEEEEEDFDPALCLFCSILSTSLDANMAHMAQTHNFFIPSPEHLIDISSLLSYLFTIISVFHECLYCGCERSSKIGVQDHMRGKGHCKINSEDEELDLMEFWGFDGGDGNENAVRMVIENEDEMRLPSGKILGHRSRARHFRQRNNGNSERSPSASTSRQKSLTEVQAGSESEGEITMIPLESRDRRVATRAGTSTSLIGIPEAQQRSLMATERKMLTIEGLRRNEYQHGVEKGGNRQKRYKVAGIGKKQGGLEKRLG